ncbi:MAG: hypothetical protein ACI8Z7_000842, partial [Candidatus Nanohaloarchaea archaeon]
MNSRIREKLREMDLALEKVEDNLPESFEEFECMVLEKDGIYKNVEMAIQSAYDICALIVKEENLGVPDEEESFPELAAEEGIITDSLSEKLKDMKGFRNALAHKYGAIDDEIAYENISRGIED